MPPARRRTPADRPTPRGGPRAHRPDPASPRRGRRPTLSLDAVLDGAVALLDEAGESALTFRALATRLGTGVGSIYHYVDGRDELLDRATDEVLAGLLDDLGDLPDDPYDALRHLADRLCATMLDHPWMGAYLLRNARLQPASMRMYDLFGRQLQRLDLTTRQRFHAVSALLSFVIGVGSEMREPPAEVLRGEIDAEQFLAEYAQTWRDLDPEQFPFVHEIADEFATHDDTDQFRAGVDLVLAGIAQQAGDTYPR